MLVDDDLVAPNCPFLTHACAIVRACGHVALGVLDPARGGWVRRRPCDLRTETEGFVFNGRRRTSGPLAEACERRLREVQGHLGVHPLRLERRPALAPPQRRALHGGPGSTAMPGERLAPAWRLTVLKTA